MDNDFEKIRQNSCTLYIHKRFADGNLSQGLLAGEEKLRKLYVLKPVPSSESTHTDKFNISINGDEKEIYLKQYLCGSGLRFIKSIFRKSRARQDFEAALMLAQNGFDAPEIVAMGERRDGFLNKKSFLATLAVENSKAIYQLFPENSKVSDKEQLRSWRLLIRALGRTVGRMHAKGIFHGDLRLGNVLARQEGDIWRFFFLDNERTRKFDRLPFGRRVKNLVQVNMSRKSNISYTDRMRFFREYCVENKINKKPRLPRVFGGQESKSLAEKVIEKTNWRLNKERLVRRKLRKCLRANTRYLLIKSGKFTAVFERKFCEGAEPIDFIEQIDAMMNKGQILKKDKTSYISRLTWNGRDIVTKRYNHKGFIHSLRHTVKGSRAKRAWLNAHRLRTLEIPTPRPLAYIEQWKGLLVWKSCLVTEYVDGQQLHHFLQNDSTTQKQRSAIIRNAAVLFNNLDQYRISHGDLKPSNILVTNNGPVLTDLDAMKFHRWNWLFKIRMNNDIARLTKNKQPSGG